MDAVFGAGARHDKSDGYRDGPLLTNFEGQDYSYF